MRISFRRRVPRAGQRTQAGVKQGEAGQRLVNGFAHRWRKQASLTMWIPVKHFLSVLLRALRRARHFALVEGSAIPTKGPLVIVSGLKLSSTHASLRSHLRS